MTLPAFYTTIRSKPLPFTSVSRTRVYGEAKRNFLIRIIGVAISLLKFFPSPSIWGIPSTSVLISNPIRTEQQSRFSFNYSKMSK